MALVAAAVLGTGAGAAAYTVAKGKPSAKPIDGRTRQTQAKNPYWRNWIGEGEEDIREDGYMYDDTDELRNEYPRSLPGGRVLPPDNDAGVNPAAGAFRNHPGWPRQQFLNYQEASSNQAVNRANRAPRPPKQRSLPTK
jgi:hypothetical protein